jgi:hypothetical protein
MADLLATVDDIAQDLRQELDRLSSSNVETSREGASVSTQIARTAAAEKPELRDAVMEHLRNRVTSLEKPIDLASLAWEVQRNFGQEVTQGWFGFGNFKSLIKDSVPNVRVTDEPPSYVLPVSSNLF